MEGLSVEVANGMTPRQADATAEITLLECAIGGCRFGVTTAHVIETEAWMPDALIPLLGAPPEMVGAMFFDGHAISVLDLRQLFWLDEEPPELETPLVMVVQVGSTPVALLVDGLIGIHEVPREALRVFTSLYVWGVKWLSGGAVLADRVISILDLQALDRLSNGRP